MQTDVKDLLSWLDQTLMGSRRAFQLWLRQEIVDDDPCDVDTLFPEERKRSSEPPRYFRSKLKP
jgi:hypothetical protein